MFMPHSLPGSLVSFPFAYHSYDLKSILPFSSSFPHDLYVLHFVPSMKLSCRTDCFLLHLKYCQMHLLIFADSLIRLYGCCYRLQSTWVCTIFRCYKYLMTLKLYLQMLLARRDSSYWEIIARIKQFLVLHHVRSLYVIHVYFVETNHTTPKADTSHTQKRYCVL